MLTSTRGANQNSVTKIFSLISPTCCHAVGLSAPAPLLWLNTAVATARSSPTTPDPEVSSERGGAEDARRAAIGTAGKQRVRSKRHSNNAASMDKSKTKNARVGTLKHFGG